MYQTQAYKTKKYLFIGTALLLLFASCKKEEKITLNNIVTSPSTNDNIYPWIKKGGDVNLTKVKRYAFLQKAKDKINILSNDSLRTKYYSRLSLAYLKLNDSLLFRETNKKAMLLSEKVNDSISHAEAHWDLASFLKNNNDIANSFYNYSEAQKVYHKIGDKFYAGRMLYNMAVIQANARDYTGSEINTVKAIELLKPIENNKELYNCFNNLGSVLNELGESDMAIKYYQTALTYQKKIEKKNILQYSNLNNIGIVYQEQDEHQKALSYFEQVFQNSELLQSKPQLYARSLSNYAYSMLKLLDTTKLPELFYQAIRIQDSLKDNFGASRTYYNLAEYNVFKADTSTAITNINKALYHATESNNSKRKLKSLALLMQLDKENTLKHSQRHIALSDSLQQAERKIRNKFTRIRFETDEFIEENKSLEKENQLWAAISIGIFIVGLFVFIIILQSIKNEKLKFSQQQQESNQELFNLMLYQKGKLEEGKHIEQKRISEELHDGILGQMLGIRLILLGLNKKTDTNAVKQRAEMIVKLQDVEEEVRTISHELNEASHQKIDNFIASIEELLETIAKSAPINCHFDYNNNADWDTLNGAIKINLYRILQESLQNCIKYAKAKDVFINFKGGDSTSLEVTIRDNGIGFDLKKEKRGIGLKNISSRIEKISGTWNIASKVNNGTIVTIHIPLDTKKNIDYKASHALHV
ncbi:MAG: tetratricopeptide repeat protein [Cellulophaga sp.]